MVILLIPLVIFNVSLIVGIIVTIYVMTQGLLIPGVLLLLIGLCIFFGYLQTMLFGIIFKNHGYKIHFVPYIVGFVIGIVGIVLCFDQVINLNYYDQMPNHSFRQERKVMIEDAHDVNTIYIQSYGIGSALEEEDKVVDNQLKDGQVKFELIYLKDVNHVYIEKERYQSKEDEKVQLFTIQQYRNSFFSTSEREVRELILNDFKQKKLYNYDRLYHVTVKVYANAKTLEKIKLERNYD